ncbi:MAG: tyrosine-protein phosphatase [Clostridia bacterium]|nr:tyrosine-protein phosphatase [Clostridia bacterium]
MAEEKKTPDAKGEAEDTASVTETPTSTEQTAGKESSSKHSSHHHHHHRHRHRSSRSRSGHSKDSKFSKRELRKLILLIASLLAAALVLLGIYWLVDPRDTYDDPDANASKEESVIKNGIQLRLTLFTEEQVLIGTDALEFYNTTTTSTVDDFLDDHNSAGRMDIGLPVQIGYDIDGIPAGYTVMNAAIEVSENENFADSRVHVLKGAEKIASFEYLKTGTHYYYRITLILSDGQKISTQGSFQTAATPRILSIDGMINVRDIGGWKTTDGKLVRQGLLYRGGELDGTFEPTYRITEEGIYDMLTLLGIRTDMDLRSSASASNQAYPLGTNVKHTYYGAPAYDGIFTDEGKETIRTIFADLADPDNYPVYLHCTYGLDRTGTVCYLLEALLGVSEQDVMKDYCLSLLYHRGADTTSITELSFYLNQLEGATLKQKVEGYLLSIGVTAQEIASIRSIFLEQPSIS